MNGISDMVGQVHGGHMTDYAARMEEARAYGERRAELEHAERTRNAKSDRQNDLAATDDRETWWMVEVKFDDDPNWYFVGKNATPDRSHNCGYQFRRKEDAEDYMDEISERLDAPPDCEYRVTDHGMMG